LLRGAPAAATPTIRLAVEMMPSLAPSTAARNQFARLTKWEADGGMSFGGMSRSLLKFAERTLLFKSYAASAI
jgi:hypothetical protein